MVVLSYLKIYCSYIKVGVAQNNKQPSELFSDP